MIPGTPGGSARGPSKQIDSGASKESNPSSDDGLHLARCDAYRRAPWADHPLDCLMRRSSARPNSVARVSSKVRRSNAVARSDSPILS